MTEQTPCSACSSKVQVYVQNHSGIRTPEGQAKDAVNGQTLSPERKDPSDRKNESVDNDAPRKDGMQCGVQEVYRLRPCREMGLRHAGLNEIHCMSSQVCLNLESRIAATVGLTVPKDGFKVVLIAGEIAQQRQYHPQICTLH